MQWSVLSLEATTTLASGINMLELEAEIARRGKHVDYVGLYNLAFRLSQIINGTFCGCYSARCTPSGLQDEDLKRSCDVALLCEDSSVWIVHAREGSLIKRLRSLFTDTRVVD